MKRGAFLQGVRVTCIRDKITRQLGVLGTGIGVVGILSSDGIVLGIVTFLLLVFLTRTSYITERYFIENVSRERELGIRARFKGFSVKG
jgi:hypothetical protein